MYKNQPMEEPTELYFAPLASDVHPDHPYEAGGEERVHCVFTYEKACSRPGRTFVRSTRSAWCRYYLLEDVDRPKENPAIPH